MPPNNSLTTEPSHLTSPNKHRTRWAVALLALTLAYPGKLFAQESATTSDPQPVHGFLKIGFSGILGHEAGLFTSPRGQANAANMSIGEATYGYPIRLSDRTYLMVGFQAGVGNFSGSRCLTGAECRNGRCRCDSSIERWGGLGFAYGPSLGLVMKAQDGQPYSLVWLPNLRVLNFVYNTAARTSRCGDAFSDGCGGYRADSVAIIGSIDFDFVHSFPLGCGFGIGLGAVFGDFAERSGTHFFTQAQFKYGFGW